MIINKRMNSINVHNDFLLGKNKDFSYETLMSNLWSVDDIRNRFNMDGVQRPIAEASLQVMLEKQQTENKKSENIINTVNKEDNNGESIHCIPNISKLTVQDIRNNQ